MGRWTAQHSKYINFEAHTNSAESLALGVNDWIITNDSKVILIFCASLEYANYIFVLSYVPRKTPTKPNYLFHSVRLMNSLVLMETALE